MCKRFTIVSAKRKTTPVLEGTSTAEFQVTKSSIFNIHSAIVVYCTEMCVYLDTRIYTCGGSQLHFFITSSADIF